MKKIRAAIVGYGNIGKYVLEALEAAPDFEVAGVVRRNPNDVPDELKAYTVTDSITKLDKVDVAVLATPTRSVETYAKEILSLGINTVDSFDIHGGIVDLRRSLDAVAKAHNTVAVISAGWDPGSDSVVRALLEAMVPKGITYTNFGPGMSMGHTVAVKAIEGVKAALSMTIPMGTGVHRRMVGSAVQVIKSSIIYVLNKSFNQVFSFAADHIDHRQFDHSVSTRLLFEACTGNGYQDLGSKSRVVDLHVEFN